MEGWNRHFWGWLGAAGLMLLGTQSLHAEWLCPTVAIQGACVETSFRPFAPAPPKTQAAAQATLQGLRRDWEEIRTALQQALLETTMTLFFIRIGTPPPAPKTPPPKGSPPPQTGGSTPPPPNGQGDPPGDPNTGPPPPPNSTPEPSSMVIALLGAGLVSWRAWRKRR